MADVWKTEFHVIDPDGDATDWLADRDAAITRATAGGAGWKVEEVTSYLDDRKVIWPVDDDEDDD